MNFDIEQMRKDIIKVMNFFNLPVCPVQVDKPINLKIGSVDEIAQWLNIQPEDIECFLAVYVPQEGLEGIYMRDTFPESRVGEVNRIPPQQELLYHELTHFLQGVDVCMEVTARPVNETDPYRLNTEVEKQAYMMASMFASGLDADEIIRRIREDLDEVTSDQWFDAVWEYQVKPTVIKINNRA
jgi:hypothetical protein